MTGWTEVIHLDDTEGLTKLYNEIVAHARRYPQRRLELDGSSLAGLVDAYCRAGYKKGLAEPVAVNIKEVERDASDNIQRIVEYNTRVPRPGS
jgi:hypothetical protein